MTFGNFSNEDEDDIDDCLNTSKDPPPIPFLPSDSGKKFCRYYKKDSHFIKDCIKLKGKKKKEVAEGRFSSKPDVGGSFAGSASHNEEVEFIGSTSRNSSVTDGGTCFINVEM